MSHQSSISAHQALGSYLQSHKTQQNYIQAKTPVGSSQLKPNVALPNQSSVNSKVASSTLKTTVSPHNVNPSTAYGSKTPTNNMAGKRQTYINLDKENHPNNAAVSMIASVPLSSVNSISHLKDDLNKTYSVLEGRRNTSTGLQRTFKG